MWAIVIISFMLCPSSFAERLPLRFPFHIRPGMTRKQASGILGSRKHGHPWQIPGRIVYRNFHPTKLAVLFASDKTKLSVWRKSYDAELNAAKTKAQLDSIIKKMGPTPEYDTDKVLFVNVFQNDVNCNRLRAVFSDALAYVQTTYSVGQPRHVKNYLEDISEGETENCLGGVRHLSFSTKDGYFLDLKAFRTPKENDDFIVMLSYTHSQEGNPTADKAP
jgi:hypothetical protein